MPKILKDKNKNVIHMGEKCIFPFGSHLIPYTFNFKEIVNDNRETQFFQISKFVIDMIFRNTIKFIRMMWDTKF